jgi:hypothetical protein
MAKPTFILVNYPQEQTVDGFPLIRKFVSTDNGTSYQEVVPGSDTTYGAQAVAEKPVYGSVYSPQNYRMPDTAVVKDFILASPGAVQSLTALNFSAAIKWLLIFNRTDAPNTNDVPFRAYPIPAGTANNPGVLVLDKAYFASVLNCSAGIAYAFSTDRTKLTPAIAADHFLDLNYKGA